MEFFYMRVCMLPIIFLLFIFLILVQMKNVLLGNPSNTLVVLTLLL